MFRNRARGKFYYIISHAIIILHKYYWKIGPSKLSHAFALVADRFMTTLLLIVCTSEIPVYC